MEAQMTQDDKSALKWTLAFTALVLILGFGAYAAGWLAQ
jgi:Flp pilus assembly protein protease CpaA